MASDSPYIRVAGRAIIVVENRLLVQYYRNGPDEWCTMPGGGIEKGERLDEGLKREVREELSIEIEVGPMRYVRELRGNHRVRILGNLAADFHQLEVFFEATSFKGKAATGGKTDDGATHFDWIPLDRLSEHRFFPGPLCQRLPKDVSTGYPDGAVYLGDA